MTNLSLKAGGAIVCIFVVIISTMLILPINYPETKALPPYKRQHLKASAKSGYDVTKAKQVKVKDCLNCATQRAYNIRNLNFCLSLATSEEEKKKIKENYRARVKHIPKFDDVQFAHLRFKKPLMAQRNNCTEVKFPQGDSLPLTALASIPGSGNTWSRLLIELVTGYYTGSVYSAHNVLLSEFPGEAVSYNSGRLIAIKTHHPCSEIDTKKYIRVILVIRDPVDSLKAEYNRERTNNKTAVVTNFSQRNWDNYVSYADHKFRSYYGDWIAATMKKKLDLFLLFYDDLIRDTGRALVKLAYFLGVDLSPKDLHCALRNQEGVFHRDKGESPLDQATVKNTENIDNGTDYLKEEITKCLQNRACSTSGCGFLYL